jgi:Ser/Thr protein kinase RdoA (MazF antagonist)
MLFEPTDLGVLESLIEAERWRQLVGAHLAHGDFDVTHIFHLDGVYSGLIDFGEIRGTEPLFDLGHFLLHDCETFPAPLFEHLVAGYAEIHLLRPNDNADVRTSAILLGLRQLCHWIDRGDSTSSYRIRYRTGRLRELIGSLDLGSARRFARGDGDAGVSRYTQW